MGGIVSMFVRIIRRLGRGWRVLGLMMISRFIKGGSRVVELRRCHKSDLVAWILTLNLDPTIYIIR